MALIKKQIFRPSKDENLQQFLAKEQNIDYRGHSTAAAGDKSRTKARSKGKIIKPQKAVKSEPKSPWDDESDALAQKAFEVEDREFQKGKSTSKPTRSDRRLDEEKNRPDLEGTTDDLLGQSSSNRKERMILDQGSDNSNTADDSTQKEYVEKSKYMSLDEQANLSDEEIADAEARVKKPGKGQKAKWVPEDYDADEDGPFKVDAHWSAKEFIIEGVQKAWLEKRGPVDRLTGGRVKFETDRTKQVVDRGPKVLGFPGVEMQTKLKRGGLADKVKAGRGSVEHGGNRQNKYSQRGKPYASFGLRGNPSANPYGDASERKNYSKPPATASQKRSAAKSATEKVGLEYAAKSVGDAVWDAWFEKARTKEQQSAGLKRQTPRMDKPGTPLVGSPNPQGDPWEIRDRRKELDDSIETSRQKPKEEASKSPPSMAAGGGGGGGNKPPKRPPRKQFRPESDNPSDKYPKPDYSKYVE